MNCPDEIAQRMILTAGEDGTARGSLRLPETFLGFHGHFPGNPVLPGICFIQIAEAFLRKVSGHHLHLRGLKKTKFLSIVRPDMELFITGGVSEEAALVTGDIRIEDGEGHRLALVKLTMEKEAE